MIKKLIFFIYVGDNLSPQQYQEKYPCMALHFTLLRMYANVFDESVFILSFKDNLIDDKELVKQYMNYIIDLGFYNVRFKIEKNTKFREGKAFYEEVVNNRDNSGKLVFFGHGKGISNDYNESLVRLICSMYYFSLNFIDEVETKLINYECAFYGFPLLNAQFKQWDEIEATCVMPRYKYFLYGTFYWVNWTVLNEIVTHKDRSYPELASRFYAENFPANTVEMDMVGTYRNVYGLSGRDLHKDFDGFFDEFCQFAADGKEIRKDFNKFVEQVKNLTLK